MAGLEGSPVYNLPYRGLGAAISVLGSRVPHATEAGASGSAVLEGAAVSPFAGKGAVLRHEQVVERLMEHATVLPFRFLTVFHSEEDVLAMMEERWDGFKENLARLRGKAEFGIKVLWPGDRIRERMAAARRNGGFAAAPTGGSPARRFLKKKLEEHRLESAIEDQADRRIARVHAVFAGFAAETRSEKLRTQDLLLSAAYLVEKANQRGFARAFDRLRSSPGELTYLFSGPWPPYNFIQTTPRPSAL